MSSMWDWTEYLNTKCRFSLLNYLLHVGVCLHASSSLKLSVTKGDFAQKLRRTVFSCPVYFYIYEYTGETVLSPHIRSVWHMFWSIPAPALLSSLLIRAGGILPASLSADTAFPHIPLIREPKVIDGFNNVRCNTPNKWAGAGFITNICIWGAVKGADDGRRLHDIPIIKVWARHWVCTHLCAWKHLR